MEDGRSYVATFHIVPADDPELLGISKWRLEQFDADGARIDAAGRWYVSLDACTAAVDTLEAQR
jgi:hypothetical protein